MGSIPRGGEACEWPFSFCFPWFSSRLYVGYLDVAIESESLGGAGLYLRMESYDLIVIVLYPVSVC